MRIYKNLELLDVSNAKLIAIAAYRKEFGTGVLESKEIIEKLLADGSIEFKSIGDRLENLIREYFKYDLEETKPQDVYTIPFIDDVPDAETQKALDWYALRLPFEREYIEKIIAWEKRGMTYPAFA